MYKRQINEIIESDTTEELNTEEEVLEAIRKTAVEIACPEIRKDPDIYYMRIRDKILAQDLATSNRYFELTNRLAEVIVASEEVQGAMADVMYDAEVV